MSNQFSGRQSDNRPGSADQNDGEQLRKGQAARPAPQ